MIRRLFRFIFSLFFWICACIGFGIFAIVLVLYFEKIGPFSPSSKALAQNSILSLTLNGPYVEYADSKGIESLVLGKNASLYDVTRAILYATQDEKIKGIVLNIASPHLGVAQTQELRDALLAFRKSGKSSWCYTDTFGELSPGNGLYYLATACQEIWLQPLGTLNLTGLNIEVPFAKGALDKLDVKAEIAQRKDYKSFVEMFTRESMSGPNQEALQAIADSILSQFVEGIAKERKLSHDQVRFLINNGPYLTKEAAKEKLIDHIGSYYDLMAAIEGTHGQDIRFVKMGTYLKTLSQSVKGSKIALIFGSGVIQRNTGDSLFNDVGISSNTTCAALHQAAADKDIKAIVFRVNSEGGSVPASEAIYAAIRHVKESAKKPVIISMSDAAASGGYWIAVAGSKIVAQPATLTGSIGVFGGKLVASGLFEKLGIRWGHVATSENASMWSMNELYTPMQWMKINAMMDQVYEGFTNRVAKGRKMTLEQVEKVARGRVWTGEQALALGLVDQLGGLQVALDLAKKEAGLPFDAGVQVYPPRKTFLESLLSLLEPEEDDPPYAVGILGTLFRPFKKMMAFFTFLLSSQEALYVPLGEVR